MPSDKEKRAVRSAKEKADQEIGYEIQALENLSNQIKTLGNFITLLRKAHTAETDRLADMLQLAFDAANAEFWRENNRIAGKQEALDALIRLSDVSLAGARNVIDEMIEKERAKAVEHNRRAADLFQASKFTEAARELEAAARELHKVEGKEKIKQFFY